VSPQEASSVVTGATIRAREGTLYRKIGDTAVWTINVVEGNPPVYYRRFISGARWTQLFSSCGYTDSMIRNVPASVVDAYTQGTDVDPGVRPDGQLVISGGTQYLIEAGQKRAFPSASALSSYNFPFPACSNYLPPANGAQIKAREGTRFKSSSSSAQYFIDQVGTAYHKRFLSANALANYGISGTLRTWSSSEVSGYSDLVAAHMIKGQLPDKWAQDISTSDPLMFDRSYQCTGCQANWSAPTADAINQWDSTSTTLAFLEQPYNGNSEIHVIVLSDPFSANGGWVEFYSGGVYCGDDADCPGTTYSQANVVLNDYRTSATSSGRNAMATHEFGHTASLAHDGLNPGNVRDNACGTSSGWRVPQTIMDYDCMYPFVGGLVAPTVWDVCGVNHRYYTATWGWSGC
jgi:hypothetical protein